MSGDRNGSGNSRSWLLPALVALIGVVVLVLAMRSDGELEIGGWRLGKLQPRGIGAAGGSGIALMALGLAVVVLAGRVAEHLPGDGKAAAPLIKLAGVLACGIGAIMIFVMC